MNHAKPENLPAQFDFARFEQFCERGFSHGVGRADGQVCILTLSAQIATRIIGEMRAEAA